MKKISSAKCANFDNKEFLNDVCDQQSVFTRRGDRERVMILLTYFTRRVRQVIEFHPVEENRGVIYDFTKQRVRATDSYEDVKEYY